MPEGHTLFRLAAELEAAFAGRTLRVSSPQGRFAADAAVLDGSVLVGAESAGKHLFVELDHERLGQPVGDQDNLHHSPPVPQ